MGKKTTIVYDRKRKQLRTRYIICHVTNAWN